MQKKVIATNNVIFLLERNTTMKTFILIHGSWHSAWNWHKVAPLLEKRGHKVIAMDLPGMGRDKTPINEVTMQVSVDADCTSLAGRLL
jgi:pimeloyl-ACP methyl ester carboxylesterase